MNELLMICKMYNIRMSFEYIGGVYMITIRQLFSFKDPVKLHYFSNEFESSKSAAIKILADIEKACAENFERLEENV